MAFKWLNERKKFTANTESWRQHRKIDIGNESQVQNVAFEKSDIHTPPLVVNPRLVKIKIRKEQYHNNNKNSST